MGIECRGHHGVDGCAGQTLDEEALQHVDVLLWCAGEATLRRKRVERVAAQPHAPAEHRVCGHAAHEVSHARTKANANQGRR
jgi:hypothetical protein